MGRASGYFPFSCGSFLSERHVEFKASDDSFVVLCTSDVANFSAAECALLIAVEKVGIGFEQSGIVFDGTLIVTNGSTKFGTIISCQDVFRLFLQDKVKVFDGAVQVAGEGAEQAAIIVCHKMLRAESNDLVIVIGGISEAPLGMSDGCSEQVGAVVFRLLLNGKCGEGVRRGVVLFVEKMSCFEGKGVKVFGHVGQPFIYKNDGARGVFLFKA